MPKMLPPLAQLTAPLDLPTQKALVKLACTLLLWSETVPDRELPRYPPVLLDALTDARNALRRAGIQCDPHEEMRR